MVSEAEVRALDRADELRLQAETVLRDAESRRADTIRLLAAAAREAEQLLTAAVTAIERDTAAAEAERRQAEQLRRDADALRRHLAAEIGALREVADRASEYVERILAPGTSAR